ncbi:MAG TPA: hypothetical protein VGN47_10485 [Blastococcus sp.]|jgi:hypothetical protein|nr:hypothetical protein [Blastococcus sp.]
MTRTILNSLRLLGATVAVAAAIAGFSSVDAHPTPTDLAVVVSAHPVGQ